MSEEAETKKGLELEEFDPVQVMRDRRQPEEKPTETETPAEPETPGTEEKPTEPEVKPETPAETLDPFKQLFPDDSPEVVKSKLAEYEKKISELEGKQRNPYKDETYYKLEKVAEETPDEADTYKELVFGKPDAKRLFKLNFLREHPEYKDQPEVVQRKLERTYPDLFDPDIPREDQAYKDAQMDLELDASKIKRDLLKRLDGIEIPDPEKESADVQAAQQKFVDDWKAPFQTALKDFNKISISVPNEKDTTQTDLVYEVEVPADQKQKYFEQAAMYVINANLPVGEESITKVNEFVKKQYLADNYVQIAQGIQKQEQEKAEKLWKAKINNPSTIDPAETTPSTTKDLQQEAVDILLKK